MNQYLISRMLGSRMRRIGQQRFGPLGSSRMAIEYALGRAETRRSSVSSIDEMEVSRAFEEVRAGSSTDRLLWDADLAERFTARARSLGQTASQADLIRTIIRIRKNPKSFAARGIVLSPTTASDSHVPIVSRYSYAIEFSLMRLRYLYGASIDDILIDPSLAEEFESVARQSNASLSSQDLRLGALYLRKTRNLRRRRDELFDLDLASLDHSMRLVGSLKQVAVGRVPAVPGLFELKQRDDGPWIYVSQVSDLGAIVHDFVEGRALEPMSDGAWSPDPESLQIRVIEGVEYSGVPMAEWEKRLIVDHRPLFNLPIVNRAA